MNKVKLMSRSELGRQLAIAQSDIQKLTAIVALLKMGLAKAWYVASPSDFTGGFVPSSSIATRDGGTKNWGTGSASEFPIPSLEALYQHKLFTTLTPHG